LKDNNLTYDALVNNAGIYDKNPTKDILKTNFYGIINLNNKILPYLSLDGKIIQVSSRLG
jgi:short-subunit dehydrogenase